MSITFRPPGAGPQYAMSDGVHVAKATVGDDCGAFEVFEVEAPAAAMGPPHVSPWSGVLYVLEGRITAVVDGTSYDVEPGGLVVALAGTPVTFEVLGHSARLLVVTTGDGAGRFFADFARSVPADSAPQDSLAAISAVTARHGVRLASA